MSFLKITTLILTALATVEGGRLIEPRNAEDAIPDSYIVVLKNQMSNRDFDSHISWVEGLHRTSIEKQNGPSLGGLKFKYDIHGWKGYSGSFNRESLEQILENENVYYTY